MQWRIVAKDGRIVEVMEVVGVEGSRVLFGRYLPLHDTVLKRYRVARKVQLLIYQCVFGQTALTEVHSRTDLPDNYARPRQTCMTAIWALLNLPGLS